LWRQLDRERNTIYKYLPELKQGRAALIAAPEQKAINATEARLAVALQ
jgi:hypothetical protein